VRITIKIPKAIAAKVLAAVFLCCAANAAQALDRTLTADDTTLFNQYIADINASPDASNTLTITASQTLTASLTELTKSTTIDGVSTDTVIDFNGNNGLELGTTGAVYNVKNITFQGNLSGVSVYGIAALPSGRFGAPIINIDNVIFQNINNDAATAIYAGAAGIEFNLTSTGGSTIIRDNVVSNGVLPGLAPIVLSSGGYITVTTTGNPIIFDNNTGIESGVIVQYFSSSELYVKATDGDVIFSNNKAVNPGVAYTAGALLCYTNTPVELTSSAGGNIVFENNYANGALNDILMWGQSPSYGNLLINGDAGDVFIGSGISSAVNAPADIAGIIITKTGNGSLTLGPDSVNGNYLGVYDQTGGTLTDYSTSFFGGTNNISDSTVNLLSPVSTLTLGTAFNVNGAGVNAINGSTTTFTTPAMDVVGTNNFGIDVNGKTGASDSFQIGTLTGTGTLNLSALNVIGAPTAAQIPFQAFDAGSNSGVSFDTTVGRVDTPIYAYGVQSNGNGQYSLFRLPGIDTKAQRGQAAALAAYQNQLAVTGYLFDHVYLDRGGPQESRADYAGLSSGDAAGRMPALWGKAYGRTGNMNLTQGYKADNDAYGFIAGMDSSVKDAGGGWDFMLTPYAAYNGARLKYDGITGYQDGGQGGLMGAAFKENFTGTLLAYAGGYNTRMTQTDDNYSNWFAGTAVKGAYNFYLAERNIIQPTLRASYAKFGRQEWRAGWGDVNMFGGSLDGWTLTPGMNLFYERGGWDAYITAGYVFNFDGKAGGSVESAPLPEMALRNNYAEYGVGMNYRWNADLTSMAQITGTGGGLNSVGLQAGMSWRF